MKKYSVTIVFENSGHVNLKDMTDVLIKDNERYLRKPIEEIISDSNRYKIYAIFGDDQRFDFIKYKDASYVHYTEQ